MADTNTQASVAGKTRNGIALCLSGGGFRATLFHLGSLRRLNELGVLRQIDTFSSVSGGSITNGVLAKNWAALAAADFAREAFDTLIAAPLQDFCATDLRTEVLLWDRANPINWPRLWSAEFSATDLLAKAYGKRLGFDVGLGTLTASPKFIFCGANMESGACWEFRAGPAAQMGDFYTGWTSAIDFPLAKAVAASSAHPLTFPPLVLTFKESDFTHDSRRKAGDRAVASASRTSIAVADGGLYDNLGLEPVWENKAVLLVSDAGQPFHFGDNLKSTPFARIERSVDLMENQVRALRKRWLIDMFKLAKTELRGAYWGLGSDVDHYYLNGARGFRGAALDALKMVRTDLDVFSPGEMASLVNHGYAVANVAVRKWVNDLANGAEFNFPYRAFETEESVTGALENSADRGIWDDLRRSVSDRVKDWV